MHSVSRFSLVLLIFILFSFSSSTDSQSVKLSRRNLALTDEAIQEQPTNVKSSVRKNKLSLTDQDPKPVKSKNVLLNDQDELESTKPVKKKKIASNDSGEKDVSKPAMKKKLTTVEQENDPKPIKRKNVLSDDQDEIETPKPVKKKKIVLNDLGEKDVPKPAKKKKLAAVEQDIEDDPKPVKKKKTVAIEEEENEDPKPVKKKKSSLTDDQNEVKSNKKAILESNLKNQSKPVKLKKTNSTSIPTHNSTKSNSKSQNSTKTNKINKPNSSSPPVKKTKPITSIWLETDNEDSDLISEFRDLPTQIHEAFIPDLKKISITSKAYIYKANKNMEKNMKPFVGNKFAPKIALAASCLFLILPLCLVTALFYQLNSYLSLQTFLIFIQAYLAIYFFTLAITAIATGLEPLRFFYATSPAYYMWTQAIQTFGYVLYLLVQLVHLVVSFSTNDTKTNLKQRMLALVQMLVGLAVGCHYYNAVFHRAVIGEAPRANWKVHGVYAACFMVICLCAKAERNKKAYDGGEDGKKS